MGVVTLSGTFESIFTRKFVVERTEVLSLGSLARTLQESLEAMGCELLLQHTHQSAAKGPWCSLEVIGVCMYTLQSKTLTITSRSFVL